MNLELKSLDELKRIGNRHFGDKDYDMAFQVYSLAIARGENELKKASNEAEVHAAKLQLSRLYSNRSMSAFNRKRYGAALDDAQHSVEADPQWHKALYRKAVALEALSRIDEAIACFRQCLSLMEASGETADSSPTEQVLKNAVKRRDCIEAWRAGVVELRKASEGECVDHSALVALAAKCSDTIAALNSVRYAEAGIENASLPAEQTEMSAQLLLRAKCYYLTGRLSDAHSDLMNCLRKDSTSVEAYVLLGRVLEKKGQEEEALEAFQDAVQWDDSCEEAKDAVRRLSQRTKENEKKQHNAKAARAVEDATCSICQELWMDPIVLQPCSHIFCRICFLRLDMRCPLCRKEGQIAQPMPCERRISIFSRILESDPGCSIAWYNIACATTPAGSEKRASQPPQKAKINGQFYNATQCFQRAIETDLLQTNAKAWCKLGTVLQQNSKNSSGPTTVALNGRTCSGIDCLVQSLNIRPTFQAWQHLASCGVYPVKLGDKEYFRGDCAIAMMDCCKEPDGLEMHDTDVHVFAAEGVARCTSNVREQFYSVDARWVGKQRPVGSRVWANKADIIGFLLEDLPDAPTLWLAAGEYLAENEGKDCVRVGEEEFRTAVKCFQRALAIDDQDQRIWKRIGAAGASVLHKGQFYDPMACVSLHPPRPSTTADQAAQDAREQELRRIADLYSWRQDYVKKAWLPVEQDKHTLMDWLARQAAASGKRRWATKRRC